MRGVNPISAVFRERAHPERWRVIRCHRIDETPDSWACHTKLFFKGHHYVRHITEWFPKSFFEHVKHEYQKGKRATVSVAETMAPTPQGPKRRGRPPKVRPVEEQKPCVSESAVTISPKMETPITVLPVVPPAPVSSWAEENPILAAMHGEEASVPKVPTLLPKSPPPAIMLVPDDESDVVEGAPPPQPSPGPAAAPSSKTGNIKVDLPGEYNPLAHPEKAFGALEDLVVFDEMVNSNFIASQRKMKLMKIQAESHRRLVPTRNNPIVTGAE
jgi:hypothetical protein